MMVLFWIIILIILIAHELGHVFELKKAGLSIRRFGIGIPMNIFGFRVPCLKFAIQKTTSQKINLELHPLLIGAFVEPESLKKIDLLDSSDKLAFYGGGIFINFVVAVFFMACAQMVHLQNLILSIAIAGGTVVVISIMFWCRKLFYLLLPLLSIVSGIFIIWLIISYFSAEDVFVDKLGFIAIHKNVAIMTDYSYWRLLMNISIFSLLIGLTNMLPLMGLDGWYALESVVKKNGVVKNIFNKLSIVSSGLLIFLIGVQFIADSKAIVQMIFK